MSGPLKERELEAQFRSLFERDMTPDELKYLSLADSVLGADQPLEPIIPAGKKVA